jgi:class 3 adenylate cyclase
MKNSQTVAMTVAVLLAVINAIAAVGAWRHVWAWDYALYFFWGETVLVGLLALFFYMKHLFVFFAILVCVTWTFGLQHAIFAGDVKLPMAYWCLYSLFWLVYFEIRRNFLGHSIRQLNPVYQFLFYTGYMTIAIFASCAMTGYMYFGHAFIPRELLEDFMGMSVVIPTLTIIILKIIDMIGENHVFHFLFGTYHRPVEVKRIVMFIDMVGSSAAAEKLAPKLGMDLVARFIFDASVACRTHGGDIVNYTGDGLVVLWPLFRPDKALRAYDSLNARLEANTAAYEKEFGIVPSFRMGLHAGNVVISQIGAEKLFLGVYGDVVNTAARLEQLTKDMGTRILFSKAARQHLISSFQKRIKPMGSTEVRGREGEVDIFTLIE